MSRLLDALRAPDPRYTLGVLRLIFIPWLLVERTPRMAAKYADGYNLPYVSAATAQDRLQRLHAECDAIGRDPSEIETSVNLGFYFNSDRQPDIAADGSITGGVQEAIDTIGALADVGIQGVNIAFRPPVDWDALQLYIEEVMPHFSG